MENNLQRLKADSLKDLFIKEMEAKIISGVFRPGDKLPAERDIASQMGISRSIVNAGLMTLASKGFVDIIPRKGTLVLDFEVEGTPQMLSSIMSYNKGKLNMKLLNDMIDTRMLVEIESVKLAAIYRTEKDLYIMESLLKDISKSDLSDIDELVDFNYTFHHKITIASGNIVFAMIFKSFEPVCKNFIKMFYETKDFRRNSLLRHERLYQAILEKKVEESALKMKEIILTGKRELKRLNI